MYDAELRLCDAPIVIDSYQNGREQGLTLAANAGHTIYVSEDRNSDAIVVYIGSYAPQGLSKDAYKTAKHFAHTDVSGAAEYIRKDLLRTIKREI